MGFLFGNNQANNEIRRGLEEFFKYLNRERNSIELLDEKKGGELAKFINENMQKVFEGEQKDLGLIGEIMTFGEKMSKGNFTARISLSAKNPRLNHLRSELNELAQILDKNVNVIIHALGEYTNNNFMGRVNEQGLHFDLARLAQGTNHLVNAITEILVENILNAHALNESSSELMLNIETLNRNFTQAAAALEETSAAVEEITSNIKGNTESVIQMASYANHLSSSANEGKALAMQTTTAMDEINSQVISINDAITVIDQIAFQTNILSLNAAVEAATAGEAGKGFAVVAQEVRNLATRSAEAAKDIKNLVGAATLKANEGKSISYKMIQGYTALNDYVDKTLELISNVETASKEQAQGMTQINDAVTSLDQQSQQNASVANTTYEVAKNTSLIAQRVIDNANEKEFESKDLIERRKREGKLTFKGTEVRKKAIDLSFQGEEKRELEKEIVKKLYPNRAR